MRVNLSPRRYNSDGDEQGAVAVIVALSLIALIGMIVLVVDVGGLLYRRRQMVSASDAAALAAARSCVLGAVQAGAPEAKADEFAAANLEGILLSGGIVPAETLGCEESAEGYVTVQYSSDHDLWFAGIFGSTSKPVATKATAEWASGASNPMPFIVSLGAGGSTNVFCKDENGDPVAINEDTPLDTSCFVWFDNGNNGGGAFGGFEQSVFGSLNLDLWDVGISDDCQSQASLPNNTEYAYNGGFTGVLPPLNYPDPTWVCTMSGNQDSLFGDNGASHVVGQILVFPVTDGSVDTTNSGSIDKFNVVGYTALQLDAIYDANQTEGTTVACGSLTGLTITSSTPDFDMNARSDASGCAPYEDIVNVTVTRSGGGPKPSYTFDPVTHILDWTVTGNNTYTDVSVTWDVTQSGPCGPKPSNASGHCFAVSWQGIQFGNGGLSGGMITHVIGTRLCDLTIAGSCETTG